jgi:hypothetical protein
MKTVRLTELKKNLAVYVQELLTAPENEGAIAIQYKPKGEPGEAKTVGYLVSPDAYESQFGVADMGMEALEQRDMDSPANLYQSKVYPIEWERKVPAEVRIATTVKAYCNESPLHSLLLANNLIVPCWVNSHGVVYAITDDGRKMQLMPGEYEVTMWVEQEAEAL